MSTEKKQSSHAAAWIVSLIAVVVVYVLSWGPMLCIGCFNQDSPRYQSWMEDFYKPYFWLYRNTPLQEPLDDYVAWCVDRIGYH